MDRFSFFIIALIVIILGTTIFASFTYHTAGQKSYANCTVNGKESVNTKDGHEYRVYTTCGTFKVEDTLIKLQFNSADIYGSIIEHKSYDIEAYGYRNGFLSMFPNITKIEVTSE